MTNRILVVFMTIAFAVAIFAGGPTACGEEPNIHQTKQGLSSDCIVCHQSAYAAAANPKHQDAFPETCQDCHATNLWSPLDKGVGDTIHEIDVVKTLACVGCHKKDYDKTTKPKHDPIYPTECKDCHGTDKYAPTKVDIHATPTFGKNTCDDCHKDDAAKAVPDHKAFPKTCGDCHNVGTAWKPTKTG